MKFLTNCLLLLALIPCLLFTGCVTTGTNTGPDAQDIAQQIYTDDGALIQAGIGMLLTGYEQFVVKNPEERAQLQADIGSVCDKLDRAVTLALATTNGTVTPAQLMELLKVKEEYMNRLLQSLVPIYSAGYGRLKDTGEVGATRLSLQWVKLIVEGLKLGNDFGK